MRTERWRHGVVSFLFLFCCVSMPLAAQNYQLVWSDEFNGTSIDRTKWNFDTGGSGWGNNEWEYYTSRPENASLENGMLVIKAIKESYFGSNYTSARLKTQGKASWKYGKIEARMKLPYGQGIWPAFWMLGDNISTVSWPRCGEIDIMEMIGGSGARDRTTYGTCHWDNNGSHAQAGGSRAMASGRFADDFHTFSITWTAQKIVWYLDGASYYTLDITPASLAAFQKNQFIILNLAVGGSWPGYPDATTEFPQTMMIDYVRVYQDVPALASVTLTAPENNSTLQAHSPLTLAADVKPSDTSTVVKVEFYQEGMKIGEALQAPYTFTIAEISTGYYHFTAKAIMSSGGAASSPSAAVVVEGSAETAPYGSFPLPLPGRIDMENYDMGDAGTAYRDADAVNSGNTYRSEGVDIEPCSDAAGAGYDVTALAQGEWLLYTVNVREAGSYQFSPRIASVSGGGKYHIEVDGADVTGTVAAPITLGSQSWKTSVLPAVKLAAGIHRLKFCVDAAGFSINYIDVSSAPTSALHEAEAAPKAFALDQNYPNPFNPSTSIRFALPLRETVTLSIFDVRGAEVARLIDHAVMPAGIHVREWNAEHVPSGMYFYRLTAGTCSETRRLVLQK
ncbi:MAG: family 16 glycosylhydrolase [Acidobacteriota bacterium]